MCGSSEFIFIAREARADLFSVEQVTAIAGAGLEGDRYASAQGSFSRWPGLGRSVTLIESEVIEDVARCTHLDLTNGRSRRNLVTRGIRLNELVGNRFRIGTALFRGDRLAQPCGYLEKRVGTGLEDVLWGRGGLRADILEEGMVRVGDSIELVSE